MKRLFIANRGEIARRIAVTARRLGVETVALSDRDVPPAFLLGVVTDFVRVDEEAPALYLDAARLVSYAKAAGCDSVHPGFGFLSENAGFAQKVIDAGMTWVGPRPSAIEAMASKGVAREHAEKAGVPCIMGLNGFPVPEREDGDFATLEAFAAKAGYPLLIKAAFGGGGKGMRQVHKREELRPAAMRARSEAISSFGDGALICEQYLTQPRHVEVQILADGHGRVVALGDRDCSVQRRHQKIIEEAPAPGLLPETRAALHRAAIDLARRVKYDSAGTVEFLLDWSEQGRSGGKQRFYFLEMNTRLQVEHPVTEEIFGVDLVEWQLRIARGEALPEELETRQPRGASVEVRIYAEDVMKDFFPSPGEVAAFRPAEGPGIRWENGIDALDMVTGRFDPMIAKLVATGATRETALQRLADALERTVLAGPATNVDLLIEMAKRGPFAEGPVTTHYLVSEIARLQTAIKDKYAARESLAGELLALVESNALGGKSLSTGIVDAEQVTELAFSGPGSSTSGSASNGYGQNKTGQSGGHAASGLDAGWHSASYPQLSARCGSGLHRGPDGKGTAFWYAALKRGADRKFWVCFDGLTYARELARESAAGAGAAAGGTDMTAPVPGKVIAVKVRAGDRVTMGAALFVLESMKMEFEVKAARDGVVRSVDVKVGDQVTAGLLLAAWAD